MTDIEIPLAKDRNRTYRFFEILPGALSWLMLFVPLILSLISVRLVASFVLIYLLIYFTRAIAAGIRALHGYSVLRRHQKLDYRGLVEEPETGRPGKLHGSRPAWHEQNMQRIQAYPLAMKP